MPLTGVQKSVVLVLDPFKLVHMARLSPPDRRTTLILLTPDGDGVWYGPGAPLGLRLTFGCRDRVDMIGFCAQRTIVHNILRVDSWYRRRYVPGCTRVLSSAVSAVLSRIVGKGQTDRCMHGWPVSARITRAHLHRIA